MIIGLSGAAGCGKSTAAEHLNEQHGFVRQRFAGPLKRMMGELGLSQDHLEGHLKEVPCDLLCGKTPRWAMQSIGTDWGRDMIGGDLWVNAWKEKVRQLSVGFKNFVAEDVRFLNEAEAVKSLGGIIVHISGRGGIAGSHASEGFVPNGAVHVTNTGSMDDFKRALDTLVMDISWVRAA